MRTYDYKCWECDLHIILHLTWTDQTLPPTDAVCPRCHALCEQDYTSKNVSADVFRVYVEENLNGSSVEMTTKSQRDALCAENHATYDSGLFCRKAPRKRWEDGLTFEKAQAIAAGARAEACADADLD